MTASQPVSVCVTQRFSAPPGRVFDAWLDPELIGRWMFGLGTPDEEVVHVTLDPRVGGAFAFVVRRQGEELDHIGEYLELDRPRRLVFTWGVRQAVTDSSRVALDIRPLENGSELTLTHALHADWTDYASQTEAGWTKILDSLARLLNV